MLDLDDDSKTENTRAAYKLEQIANALPTKRAGHPSSVVFLDRGRVRDPAADRAALTRPGDVLIPVGLHGEARRHRDRRHRAAADLLRLLRRARSCRSRLPSTRSCSARGSTRHGATVWLVNTGWTGGPFGEGERMPIAATRALLARGARPASSRAPSSARTAVFGFEVPTCRSGRRLERCSTRARPGATPRRTTARRRELAADVPRELRAVRGRRRP